jgi:hypothetical protein
MAYIKMLCDVTTSENFERPTCRLCTDTSAATFYVAEEGAEKPDKGLCEWCLIDELEFEGYELIEKRGGG